MSRKKKSPAKKPTRHTDLFAEVSAEVKEFRHFMVGKTTSRAEAIYAHLRALEDAVGDVENAVDDINFCDDGIVKADGTFVDLRDRAIAVATLALSLVKEIEPRKAAPLARSVRLSNGAGFSYSTLSRDEAIGRLRLMASRPGADVKFFSSDDPLPN
ncbi:hypothetical protein [uncultured Serratia sp.]|uniref:hypothetical protein n=1 Tax=uncultured Serratia sp. TaxID=239175 RepID=UPI002584CCFD|nr:hypothetical protein [uncultured Serratia sp.]